MTLSKGFAAILESERSGSNARPLPTVLVVDDEPDVLQALKEQLEATYRVLVAELGRKALEMLSAQDVAVIVSDQRMPAMSGSALLQLAGQRSPDTVRVLITGYADLTAVIEAVNRGRVYYYLWAVSVAERLRASVAELRVERLPWSVTASFGVAEWRALESPEGWLARADCAMYDAKSSGRNRVSSKSESVDGTKEAVGNGQ